MQRVLVRSKLLYTTQHENPTSERLPWPTNLRNLRGAIRAIDMWDTSFLPKFPEGSLVESENHFPIEMQYKKPRWIMSSHSSQTHAYLILHFPSIRSLLTSPSRAELLLPIELQVGSPGESCHVLAVVRHRFCFCNSRSSCADLGQFFTFLWYDRNLCRPAQCMFIKTTKLRLGMPV